MRHGEVFANKHEEWGFLESLFAKNKDKLNARAKQHKKRYMQYLNAVKITGDKIMVVDGVTGAYSSLRLLQACLGKRIAKGLFTSMFRKRDDLVYSSYKKEILDPPKDEACIVLSKLFLTAPTTPCVGVVDGKPIFAEASEHEQKRREVFLDIEKGIDEYVDDFVAWFPDRRIWPSFSCETVLSLFRHFIDTLNPLDKFFFGQVYHSADNERYVPILTLLKG